MSPLINVYIVISLVFTLAYLVGLLIYVGSNEENRCEMTFMFEYPQFVRVSNEMDQKYPKYGLYAYSEGRLTERARDMYFDGIPALFIPGNAGSYKQVRSLASVALRKAINSRMPYHFDYFTVDLNAELTGLNGALLSDQLDYVNSSLYRVLELYKHRRNPPTSIILFGHSMGGIIARRLVADLGRPLVSIVLTLASPHRRAPVLLDRFTRDFYAKIDQNTSNPFSSTFVSVAGGYNDLLVPSALTKLPQGDDVLNIEMTHIPLAWVSADHLCILWCKQSILAINRALYDSVDPKTRHISTNANYRSSVFHHHLVHHSGISARLLNQYNDTKPNIKNNGEWMESISRQYTIQLSRGTKDTHWYMVRLYPQHPQHESLTVVAMNLETVDWAFVCGAHIPRGSNRICEEFNHLTHWSEISPSARYKRRTLRVNMHEIAKSDPTLTHIVLRVLPTSEPVIFHIDVYNSDGRRKVVDLPHSLSLRKTTVLEETPEKAVTFELAVPQLQHIIQSYQLYVDVLRCGGEYRHATASLIVPWADQNYHKHFTETDATPMRARLYDSRPQLASNLTATIRLTLDPSCRYTVSIKSNIPEMLGQMARVYSPLLITNVAAALLMALSAQLRGLDKERKCSVLFAAIQEGAKPYYILTGVKLLTKILSFSAVTKVFPTPDWVGLVDEGLDFFWLPLLLFICGVGVVWLLGIALCVSLVTFETTVHKFTLKLLARTVSFTVVWSDYFLSALHKLPCVVAVALISLTFATTGGLSLCLGALFYFLRLTQMSQDYVEELVWYYVKKLRMKFKRKTKKRDYDDQATRMIQEETNDGNQAASEAAKGSKEKKNVEDDRQIKEATNSSVEKDEKPKKEGNDDSAIEEKILSSQNAVFFHATLFMIWTLVALINVPTVLTWAHNFKYSTVLRPDPAFFPGLILSTCALPLWQLDVPYMERKWYKELGYITLFVAFLSLIYAPISIFRLNYFLTGVVVMTTLHQLVAKNREADQEAEEGSPPADPHISYDSVKAKLD